MSTIDVKVPDIGDFSDVPVIEVLVKTGDHVNPEDALITLESDKATMDVPAPAAGTVKELRVKVGDKVSEGALILVLDAGGDEARAEPRAPAEPAAAAPALPAKAFSPAAVQTAPRAVQPPAKTSGAGAGAKVPGPIEVKVPDIGDFKDVPVIEVLVKEGDTVNAEDALVTLESDKATMDVPSPSAGTVKALKVKVGDKVSEGSAILTLEGGGSDAATAPPTAAAPQRAQASVPRSSEARSGAAPSVGETSAAPSPASATQAASEPASGIDREAFRKAHASPSVRAFARELGVDVAQVKGSGPKGRIMQEDVKGFVKAAMRSPTAPAPGADSGAGLGLLPWPKVDFAKFGPVEAKPLSRIKKISGANLHRNWVMIPHVTQYEDADVTDLEALRIRLNKENEKAGIRMTMLAFMIKTCVAALQKFPDFNASLEGDNIVYKHYYNIGFAADTPNGLVVPVVKNADQKGVVAIAKEMGELSAKAREGKLGPADMQGGTFSISSLGGIGGTAFTPIINAPEVAILGLSKTITKPVWDGNAFAPRLILPLSLSYDHRVIDGAAGARFVAYLAMLLGDLRRSLL